MAGQLNWRAEATGSAESDGSGALRRTSRLTRWTVHVTNNRTTFGFAFLLILIHGILMAVRVYQYRQSCLWVIVARASGNYFTFINFLVQNYVWGRFIQWKRPFKQYIFLN